MKHSEKESYIKKVSIYKLIGWIIAVIAIILGFVCDICFKSCLSNCQIYAIKEDIFWYIYAAIVTIASLGGALLSISISVSDKKYLGLKKNELLEYSGYIPSLELVKIMSTIIVVTVALLLNLRILEVGSLLFTTYIICGSYLLSRTSTSGLIGQFRTPRHIISMMVNLVKPAPDEVICDPACGTSGFLISAGEYLKANHKEEIFFDKVKKDHYMNHMFVGYDMDRTMLRIGAMNMMTHGVDNPYIEYKDSLSDQNPDKEKYSLILANPPFKGSLDSDTVSIDLLKVCKTKKTELLFLALFLRMLKVGGRCACIVPDGVLFGSSKAHKDIRKEIIENNRLEAIISMPSGVFKPYAGVSTAIMIFTKTGAGGTDNVWFYDMKSDGLSLDDKCSPVQENDIPDIIERFSNLEAEKERKKTDQSFFVTKEEIVENEYDLSINKYKEVEYIPVEYPPTEEILKSIDNIEEEIQKELKELKLLLK